MRSRSDPARRRRAFWLRAARVRAGYSQEDVAILLGWAPDSSAAVSTWERGTKDISSGNLAKLARLYRVPVEVFTQPVPDATEVLDALVAGARSPWEDLRAA